MASSLMVGVGGVGVGVGVGVGNICQQFKGQLIEAKWHTYVTKLGHHGFR